jgi:uncharacterized protein (TIGR03084 family)
VKLICADLRDEYEELDAFVSACSEQEWQQATPFYGWSIYDEIAHLCYSDSNAMLAMEDAVAFKDHAQQLVAWMEKENRLMAFTYEDMGKPTVTRLLSRWREVRTRLLQRAEAHDSKDRFPWYGAPMSNKSLLTARIMEVWAHGQDIYDTLKIDRKNSDRTRHIAQLGVATYPWSFVTNNQEPPKELPYIELKALSGELWCWGDKNSKDHVSGPAVDFCLLVTRRRHLQDLAMVSRGKAARAWLPIAQCFAGPPEPGPEPGERTWT